MHKRRPNPITPLFVYPLPSRFRRAADRLEGRWRLSRAALAAKRGFDILGSALLLLLTSPLFVFLMLWIPLDSPGFPFYVHARVGLHGRIFRLYKFRTMSRGSHARRGEMISGESDRLFFKRKQDPRVTRLGRFLRRYSLDELPQLWNVLRGEMSLIGPRPLLPDAFEVQGFDALYTRWVRDRHLLWPGLTGLWQVAGRNDLSVDESMRLDLWYVAHWNFQMEALILLKTLPAVLSARGAY